MRYILLTPLLALALMLTSCGLLGDRGGSDDDGPDHSGNTIVFDAEADNNTTQVFSMDTTGGTITQLTNLGRSATNPSWSPEGDRIVFSSFYQSTVHNPSLYLMDADVKEADATDIRPMNPREGSPYPTSGSHARWHPDGTKIAFDRCQGCSVSTSHVIFAYDFETDRVTQLTVRWPGQSDVVPIWNTDGSRIAFYSDRNHSGTGQDIYIMEADGEKIQRVTTNGMPGNLAWKNTEEILLVTNNRAELRTIAALNIETGDLTPVIENIVARPLLWIFWQPKNQIIYTIDKSHDELPVTLRLYKLNGKLLEEIQLNAPQLRTAASFDIHFPEE